MGLRRMVRKGQSVDDIANNMASSNLERSGDEAEAMGKVW
jgi:hypothetical protein